MCFKILQLYRLTVTFELTAEQLHEKLQADMTRPCQGLDTFTLGWDKPLGRDGEMLTHAINGCIMVSARKEERILPSAVVREVLDEKVVGKLMKLAVQWGRETKPDLSVGICGEHGGHPQSIDFCHRAGLNYVSCSAPRVPVARLAAAHAALIND
mgnify:CR=1 FL=1